MINNNDCDILNKIEMKDKKIEADNVGPVTSEKEKKAEPVQTDVPTYDRAQTYERVQTYERIQAYERIQPYERVQTYERLHTQYNLEELLAWYFAPHLLIYCQNAAAETIDKTLIIHWII